METLNEKTVLVTGASGFLGGVLAMKLAQEGAQVRALVRRPERAARLQGVSNIEIVVGDITAPDSLTKAVDGCTYVIHTAISYGTRAEQQAVNVEGTRAVTEAAAHARVARIVHVSSIAAYGYKQTGDVREDTQPLLGIEPYNLTKAAAEVVVRDVCMAHELSYSIARPGFIYGPRAGMWTEKMFRLARMRPTPFFGQGDGTAHPTHVEDVASLLCTLAVHPNAHNQIFNCTPDPAPMWRTFLGQYARLAGHQNWLPIPVIVPYGIAAAARLLFPHGQAADLPDLVRFFQRRGTYRMDKARDLLGWSPQVTLQAGIDGCAPWLREIGLLR